MCSFKFHFLRNSNCFNGVVSTFVLIRQSQREISPEERPLPELVFPK